MLNRKRFVLVLVLVGLLVASSAACRQSGGNADPEAVAAPKDQVLKRRVQLEISGARSVTLDRRVDIRVLTREAPDHMPAAAVGSVTLPIPIEIETDLLLTAEVALVGIFKGDGRYTVNEGGLFPPPGVTTSTTSEQQAASSVIQVSFIAPKATPPEVGFGYRMKPCVVVLENDATEGSAECPELASLKGERISLKMRWEA